MLKGDNLLCRKLGYAFKNPQLLDLALSHRSVGQHNNERLEFLGDSLVNFIVAAALFEKFPDANEGHLSRLRANLVQGPTLAAIAREFDLGDSLRLGEGELKSGGFRRESILADALEAIIGAMYLDGGMDSCKSVVLNWFYTRLEDITLENTSKDSKTRLQEYLQERKRELPIYTVVETKGEAHSKEFFVACRLKLPKLETTASASNKRKAEKLAAEKMLERLDLQ